jgi:hypothetical protein
MRCNRSCYQLVINGACLDTPACQSVFLTGIASMYPATITIFPNPTSGVVHIVLDKQNAPLTLMEITGKQIEIITTAENIASFDLSRLTAGVYFIKVQTGSQLLMYRIVKQ